MPYFLIQQGRGVTKASNFAYHVSSLVKLEDSRADSKAIIRINKTLVTDCLRTCDFLVFSPTIRRSAHLVLIICRFYFQEGVPYLTYDMSDKIVNKGTDC